MAGLDPYLGEVKALFDLRAPTYDSSDKSAHFHHNHADRLVYHSDIQSGQDILDLCCGTGLAARSAHRSAHKSAHRSAHVSAHKSAHSSPTTNATKSGNASGKSDANTSGYTSGNKEGGGNVEQVVGFNKVEKATKNAVKSTRVFGLDLSGKMIEEAAKAAENEGWKDAKSRFLVCDVASLSAEWLAEKGLPVAFDRILCASAFVYIRDPPAAMRKWAKLLKPNGCLCISGFAKEFQVVSRCLNLAAEACGIQAPYPNQHTGDTRTCLSLIEDCGLSVRRIVWEDQEHLPLTFTPEQAVKMFQKMIEHPITARWAGCLSESQISLLFETFKALVEKLSVEGPKGSKVLVNDRSTVYFVARRKPDIKYVAAEGAKEDAKGTKEDPKDTKEDAKSTKEDAKSTKEDTKSTGEDRADAKGTKEDASSAKSSKEDASSAKSTKEDVKEDPKAAGHGYTVVYGNDGVARVSSGSTFEAMCSYSRAVVVGDEVYVSGTTGYDYTKMEIHATPERQTEQCFRNISSALDACGSSIDLVFRIRIHLAHAMDFPKIAPIVGKWMKKARPANTTVVSQLVAPEMRVEIEVTAKKAKAPFT
ncbi:hypothetical protein AAMO2058_000778300 [Amorphochlora amoebiformis]